MARNKKIAIVIVIIILLIGIPVGIYYFLFSAPEREFELERIVINLGITEEELIPKLKEQGYIKSEWAFKLVLKIRGLEGEIKPGGYKISKSWNAWKLALALANFRYQNWIVIPEGLRKEEIAEIAEKELRWSEDAKEEFLNYAKEGYLFPDTYLLDVIEDTGKKAAERMENNFNENCQAIFKEFEKNNIRNDTAVILASIIQREAASEEEMPLIAGIIWNRLLHDPPMKLEIDATIQYIVGESGKWWPPVKPEQYKIESPYNTYLIQGRPAAPICNPGLAAMEAVVHDQPSEYLYYLHDSEGQIHLAKTYEEHLENIEQYLR